jgi:RNA polymerase-binding transcription factor DksA
MPEHKPTKEQLERRRDEINTQLSRVNEDLQMELDRDPEEQAIQLEQDEVSITMEENLRKELAIIEDQLLDLEDEKDDRE